jgi:hypothetical protein
MAGAPAHAELDGGVPAERDHGNTEASEEDSHAHVWNVVGVRLSALEFELAVPAGKKASKPNEHLAQRRVDIEVKLALNVVSAELAEVGLVPDDVVRVSDAIEARPAREKRVDRGRDMLRLLLEELALARRGAASAFQRMSTGG